MGFFVYTNSIDLHTPLSESKIFDGIGDGIGGVIQERYHQLEGIYYAKANSYSSQNKPKMKQYFKLLSRQTTL